MNASRKPDRVLGATLLVAAVALAGLTGYEWQAGQGLKAGLERQVRSGTARPAPLKTLPPFALLPLDAYSGIVQHPLFVPSRQPAPAASAVAAPTRKLILTGIATDASGSVVLFKDLQTGETERLKLGDPPDASGLQLGSVDGNSVVVRQGQVQQKFELQVAPSPSLAAPGPGSPAGARANAPTPAAVAGHAAPLAPVGAASQPSGAAPAQPPSVPPRFIPNPGLMLRNIQRAKQGLPPLSQ
jgi:hypothetical protein